MFLSITKVLTAGTDGHAVIWPLATETERLSGDSSDPTLQLAWHHPARIHQNSSKAMTCHSVDADTWLIVSGGDDGSLACILARVRLWEIVLRKNDGEVGHEISAELGDALVIQRLGKVKTNVADVSSMAVLDKGDDVTDARVLICGVGMEVIRIAT